MLSCIKFGTESQELPVFNVCVCFLIEILKAILDL